MTSSINSAKPFDGLDIEALIGEVARRHNILISPDDPIFATITLNEQVLARTLEHQQMALIAAQDQIVATTTQQITAVQRLAERLITAASEHIVAQTHTAITEATERARSTIKDDLRKAHQLVESVKTEISLLRWGAVAVAVIFILVFTFWSSPAQNCPTLTRLITL